MLDILDGGRIMLFFFLHFQLALMFEHEKCLQSHSKGSYSLYLYISF